MFAPYTISPNFLGHYQGLLRRCNVPCELEESQSRFDLGDADASLVTSSNGKKF